MRQTTEYFCMKNPINFKKRGQCKVVGSLAAHVNGNNLPLFVQGSGCLTVALTSQYIFVMSNNQRKATAIQEAENLKAAFLLETECGEVAAGDYAESILYTFYNDSHRGIHEEEVGSLEHKNYKRYLFDLGRILLKASRGLTDYDRAKLDVME